MSDCAVTALVEAPDRAALHRQHAEARAAERAANEIARALIAAGHPCAAWGLAQAVEHRHRAEADRLHALLYPNRVTLAPTGRGVVRAGRPVYTQTQPLKAA